MKLASLAYLYGADALVWSWGPLDDMLQTRNAIFDAFDFCRLDVILNNKNLRFQQLGNDFAMICRVCIVHTSWYPSSKSNLKKKKHLCMFFHFL